MTAAGLTARMGTLAGLCAAGMAAAMMTLPTTARAGTPTASYETRSDQVWLTFKQDAAESFVNASSHPGAPGYRHFLGPAAYTQRFGPSAAQVAAVEAYLTRNGFTQVHASLNDVYVSAIPAASDHRPLIVPAALSRDVLAVTGPNGVKASDRRAATGSAPDILAMSTPDGRIQTHAISPIGGPKDCSSYWGQKTETFSPAYDGITTAAVPVCGYSATQIRSAYGVTAADTGAGRTIALIEVGGPDELFRTLTLWARSNGLPAPRASRYREESIGGGAKNTTCIDGSVEESALDSESAYAMADHANQLVVDGDDCDDSQHGSQALADAMLVPLVGHGSSASASVESVSYGTGTEEATTPPALLGVFNAVALRAAAEGVTMLISSGDAPGVDPPASDPYVTAVGGTTLAIGAENQRLFETGWSTDFGERVGTTGDWTNTGLDFGSGGGVSQYYSEPSYQKGVVPGSMLNPAGNAGRAVPDIAAVGDPSTGVQFGVIYTRADGKATPYSTFRQAGTSTSSPLVAGMIADAEAGQSRDFGFINPLLYSLSGSSAFHDALPITTSDPQIEQAFFLGADTDIDNHFAPGYLVGINDAQDQPGTTQVTAPGYDTMTGLGSPNGPAFIRDLRSGT